MSKAKPKYIHPIGGWSLPVELTEDEKKKLTEICDDPKFIESVAVIVGDYLCDREMIEQIPTEAEDLATLEDLKNCVHELERKLSKLDGGRVGARLYKVSEDIEAAKKSLQKIYIETILAIQKHPEPKAGRTPDKAKIIAARKFKSLFERYSVEWNISIYESPKPNKSHYSPAIIILSTFLKISPKAAEHYIKKV